MKQYNQELCISLIDYEISKFLYFTSIVGSLGFNTFLLSACFWYVGLTIQVLFESPVCFVHQIFQINFFAVGTKLLNVIIWFDVNLLFRPQGYGFGSKGSEIYAFLPDVRLLL